jgi:hypothetical protein
MILSPVVVAASNQQSETASRSDAAGSAGTWRAANQALLDARRMIDHIFFRGASAEPSFAWIL